LGPELIAAHHLIREPIYPSGAQELATGDGKGAKRDGKGNTSPRRSKNGGFGKTLVDYPRPRGQKIEGSSRLHFQATTPHSNHANSGKAMLNGRYPHEVHQSVYWMLMFQAVNFKQAKATGSDDTVDLLLRMFRNERHWLACP
jgi:hypothetical protein